MATTGENRAGQAKSATAGDVAGSTSVAGAGGTPGTTSDTTTETIEVAVHETAGPLGAHYVTGADGKPIAVDAASQPPVAPGQAAQASVAVVDITSPANLGPSLIPDEHVTVVREVIPGEPAVPVIANPGPPSETPEGAKVAHAKPDPE